MARKRGKKGKAIEVLSSVAADVRGLSDLGKQATPAIIGAAREVLEEQVDRGEDPTGRKWKKRKLDGGRPLKGAAGATEIVERRGVILMRLTGHHAKHHVGAVKGKTRRRILPSRKLPNPYADAIREALVAKFNEKIGGGS